VLESTSSASVSPGCARNTAHACKRLSCRASGAWSRPACAGAVARAGTPLAAAASGVPPGFFEPGAGAGDGPPGAARADSLESAGAPAAPAAAAAAPAGVPAGFFEVRRSEVHACGGGGPVHLVRRSSEVHACGSGSRVHLAPTPSTPSCIVMLLRARSAGLPRPRLPPCCSAAGRAGQRRPQAACIAARSSLLPGARQRRWSITRSSVCPELMARAPQAQAAAAAPPEADAADAGPPAKRQRAGAGAAPPAADAPGALPKGAAPAVRWGLELQALSGALGSAPCKL